MTQKLPALPPVAFNHLYIVLDDKTYHSIIHSEYLQVAFPGKERRSTLTAAGEAWSGTYFYCQDSYVEFFGSTASRAGGITSHDGHWQPGAQEGWAGLAFSTSRHGGASGIRERIRQDFRYEPYMELRQLNAGQKTVNWFTMVSLAEPLSLGSFDSWLMEYHPDIYAHKGLAFPEDGELTVRSYLAQWNQRRVPLVPAPAEKDRQDAGIPWRGSKPKEKEKAAAISPPVADPVFTNITGAAIHMDTQRAARYAKILSLLGFTMQEEKNALLLTANNFTLRICPEEGAPPGYRLSSLRLSMGRPSIAPMTFVFAPRSRLVLNDDLTADWYFGE